METESQGSTMAFYHQAEHSFSRKSSSRVTIVTKCHPFQTLRVEETRDISHQPSVRLREIFHRIHAHYTASRVPGPAFLVPKVLSSRSVSTAPAWDLAALSSPQNGKTIQHPSTRDIGDGHLEGTRKELQLAWGRKQYCTSSTRAGVHVPRWNRSNDRSSKLANH
ncbi:uncharacterized protein M421DRAFT_243411 [Didymella exigua CBS 183.55]|uniref:Uncharacterized protein n=1 Tax=Didymella exigua CBS 183.55 TaxID=1150837 RepID=A0A6A5REF0_9PLEO|nr:uncharacterized protein M421DRAFT_243411 [Didymella exigua CBS 183.55]KAF1925484.1 hypothetical protein M421DRAFT_243411 [Didymella exigua CBS 183.55]